MEVLLNDVNWVAVAAGGVAAFLVGWLWYSDKLFGAKWRDGIGIAVDDQTPMLPAMITQVASTFLLAWVVGVLETTGSIALTVLVALTIAGLIKANGLFAQKSLYAIRVETGFIVVMVIIMVAAHAVL